MKVLGRKVTRYHVYLKKKKKRHTSQCMGNDEVERMKANRKMSQVVMVVSQAGDVLRLECQWRKVDAFKVYDASRIDQPCR